jgi:hypothetical protein
MSKEISLLRLKGEEIKTHRSTKASRRSTTIPKGCGNQSFWDLSLSVQIFKGVRAGHSWSMCCNIYIYIYWPYGTQPHLTKSSFKKIVSFETILFIYIIIAPPCSMTPVYSLHLFWCKTRNMWHLFNKSTLRCDNFSVFKNEGRLSIKLFL